MIIKSLIIASIIFNFLGLDSVADKIDNAVVLNRMGAQKVAVASDFDFNNPLPEIIARPTIKPFSPKATANARHYILVDPDTNMVLAKNDAKARVPIASTTKIMTALLVLENYKLDEVVTISETAAQQIGADAYLRVGEQITVENLLNCMLIKSGNDSAYALAEHMSNNNGITEFIAKMNARAKELGMNDTNYQDPAGLDTTGYSSAYDLYLVTKEALKFPKFQEIVKKQSWVAKNIDSTIYHELKQSNRLVAEYNYPGAIGVKTGYMPEAGHVLVGAAERNGHTLISIVINTYLDTPSASADEARRLLDWGFTNITWQN